jgi:hypothetical protein
MASSSTATATAEAAAPRLPAFLTTAFLIGIVCLIPLSVPPHSIRRTTITATTLVDDSDHHRDSTTSDRYQHSNDSTTVANVIRSTTSLLNTSNTNIIDNDDNDSTVIVSVQFYGEAMCPYCRKFVTEAWPTVWDDEGIRPLINYDMIPWGNAYFATTECGVGPYSSDERACWYNKCISPSTTTPSASSITTTKSSNSAASPAKMGYMEGLSVSDSKEDEDVDDDCFTGSGVYQHGEKEGIIDIYETCIKDVYSLDDAVTFAYCAEGSIMDNSDLDAYEIMTVCVMSLNTVDSLTVEDCYTSRGRELEIANAKVTPSHPGVPYVLLDGVPLDDPLSIKTAICERLLQRGMKETDLPDSCRE